MQRGAAPAPGPATGPATAPAIAPGIVTAPMTARDLPAVQAMHATSLAELAGGSYTAAEIAAYIALIESPAYAEDLRASDLWLALAADGAPLASAGWLGMPAEPGTARLRKVFTAPGHARRGLAGALVRAAEARAQAAGHRRLVARVHLNAVPFWRRMGYLPLHEDRMPVGHGASIAVLWMERQR